MYNFIERKNSEMKILFYINDNNYKSSLYDMFYELVISLKKNN